MAIGDITPNVGSDWSYTFSSCTRWTDNYNEQYDAINAITKNHALRVILHGVFCLDQGQVREIGQEPGHDAFFLLTVDVGGVAAGGVRVLTNGDQYHIVCKNDYVLMREEAVPTGLKRSIKKLVNKYKNKFKPLEITGNKITEFDAVADRLLRENTYNAQVSPTWKQDNTARWHNDNTYSPTWCNDDIIYTTIGANTFNGTIAPIKYGTTGTGTNNITYNTSQ